MHRFLIARVGEGAGDPVQETARTFRLSERTIKKHLEQLAADGQIVARGKRGRRRYDVPPYAIERGRIEAGRGPGRVWLDWLGPRLQDSPETTRDVFWFALEELLEELPGEAIELTLVRTIHADTLVLEQGGTGFFADRCEGRGEGAAEVALQLASGGEGDWLEDLGRVLERVCIDADGIRLERRGPGEAWRLGAGRLDCGGTRIELGVHAEGCRGLLPLANPDPKRSRRRAWMPAHWIGTEGATRLEDSDRTGALLCAAHALDELTLDFLGIEELAGDLADQLFGKARPEEAPPVRRAAAGPEVEAAIRAALVAARK